MSNNNDVVGMPPKNPIASLSLLHVANVSWAVLRPRPKNQMKLLAICMATTTTTLALMTPLLPFYLVLQMTVMEVQLLWKEGIQRSKLIQQ